MESGCFGRKMDSEETQPPAPRTQPCQLVNLPEEGKQVAGSFAEALKMASSFKSTSTWFMEIFGVDDNVLHLKEKDSKSFFSFFKSLCPQLWVDAVVNGDRISPLLSPYYKNTYSICIDYFCCNMVIAVAKSCCIFLWSVIHRSQAEL
mmetsp:Transcript_19977/g.27539  ORF Transcript_19977/g.27539 Transcript_19977/m.27539 type:complete len:148 (-) Transcript_19977:218-661(-)